MSGIDLDDQLKDLKEEELKEMHEEERRMYEEQQLQMKQQNEFFTSKEAQDLHILQRQYGQLNILYKVRGRALEDIGNKYTAFQAEWAREKRVMTHKITMTEQELQEVRSKLDQAIEREICFKAEIEKSIRVQSDHLENIEKLKQVLLLFVCFIHF